MRRARQPTTVVVFPTMEQVTSVLILAGTSEATKLADRLVEQHGVEVTSSLAGLTTAPTRRAGTVRRGGFGGTQGLADFLAEGRFDAVVDATHPFAAVMPFQVAAAAATTATPSCRLLRPRWHRMPGDRWIEVRDLPGAAAAVDTLGVRRVMLAVGRQSTWAFATTDAWFLVRAIDPPDQPLDRSLLLRSRGPYDLESERALLAEHGIEALVTKNSGGSATAAKLVAARELGIPVVIVDRPEQPPVPLVPGVDQALDWLGEVTGMTASLT